MIFSYFSLKVLSLCNLHLSHDPFWINFSLWISNCSRSICRIAFAILSNIFVGLFLGCLLFLAYHSAKTTQSWLVLLYKSSNWVHWFLHFIFLFQNCFCYSSSFAFPYKFFNNLVHVYKNLLQILIRISLNLCISLGEIEIFTVLSLLIHERSTSFHVYAYLSFHPSAFYGFQYTNLVLFFRFIHKHIFFKWP